MHTYWYISLSKSLWWVDTGWMPGAHQRPSITPSPQLDRGRANTMKGLWVTIKIRDISHQLPSWAKQTQLREISLLPIKSEKDNEK